MAQAIAFIDDQYVPATEAKVSILEPTFTKSDIIYDTLTSLDGLIFRLDDHLDRFENSCRTMELAPPYTRDQLKRITAECIDRSGYDDTCITLMATRGPFIDFAVRDIRRCKNGLIALAVPYYWVLPKDKQETGINLVITETRRVPAESIDARVKNFNWMDLTRGLLEAYRKGGDSALLCTPDGKLAEGYGFNVWLVKDGRLYTPKGNLLEGITRKSVFEIASDLGVAAEEAELEPQDLQGADEAFTSTTAGAIMPVTQVDGKPLGNGAPGLLTTRIDSEYWKRRKAGWHGTPVKELLEDREVA